MGKRNCDILCTCGKNCFYEIMGGVAMGKMKGWLAALCVLCRLLGGALAEGAEWTGEAWAQVSAALASDDANPVPAERRTPVGPGQVSPRDPARTWDGWASVLLMSTDAPDPKDNFGRTDAVLVCRISLKTGDVRLLSLPEDVLVPLAGLPAPVPLRHVNCFGGPLLVMKTLNEALGLSVNRYCAVNTDAFVAVVDGSGGVLMDLSPEEARALGLEEGGNLLDGEKALRYVKLRRQGGDARRLRSVLEAVLRQAASAGGTAEKLGLLDLLLPRIDTNMTTDDLLDCVFALFGQETPGTMTMESLAPGEDGSWPRDAEQRCGAFLYAEGE